MARNNATVTYIEPNDIYDSLDKAAGGNIHYDRAPDLEDYCIAMNIGVEVSSREDALRKQESENKVLIMCYRDDGNKSSVSFMSGTKLGGYTKDKDGKQIPRLDNTYNAMTSYPLDMYVTDLVDYGTTELLGVKSVNIDYNSGYIPKIRLVMTDVRGMSLFQPKELNYDNSFNGIRGLSKDNVAQTFFQCFFTLPLPKFTIQVKGFYGRPVTYQMMCEKFNTNFNSSTGDFDVEADFIGYGFSFMSDISFDALLAAPYSDYNGESYWNSQINAGRFKIPDKTGQHMMDMPRLYDIRKNFAELFDTTNDDFQIDSLSNEERTHDDEIRKLGQLKEDIKSWYVKLYEVLKNKYGEKLVYLFKNGENYERVLLLSNAKDNPSGNLGEVYKQLDESFRNVNEKLYSSIEDFNKTGIKLKNVSKDFTDYTREKIFRKLYINTNTNQIVFDGFDPDCELPRKKTMQTVFPEGNDVEKLRKFYNDGVNQYIHGFIIELDYESIENRLKALFKDSNMSDSEKVRREKIRRYNQSMFANMNWYPTIENFTKIMMAHLETLMHMMYVGAQAAENRTVNDMGLSLENLSDVPANNKMISLFPRVTKFVTGDDGIVKKEDAWIGEFNLKGDKVPEVDIVNGLFNGISEIHRLESEIQAQLKENDRGAVVVPTESSVVKYPTTPYDFYITKNIYGDGNVTNLYSFIGKICMRMFNVLAINTFRYEYNEGQSGWTQSGTVETLGELEAVNFHELNRIRNTDVFRAISSGGIYDNADKILSVVTNNDTQDNLPEMPWGDKPLFTRDLWLERYKVNETWIYPAQNMDFQELEEVQKQVFDGVYSNENDDIILSDVKNWRKLSSNYLSNRTSDNAFFNMFIEEDRTKFEKYLDKANGGGDNYTNISETFIRESISYDPEETAKLFDIQGKTSYNETLTGDNKPVLGARKGVREVYDHKAEEDNICEKYKISGNTVIEFLSSDNNSIPNKCTITEVFGYRKTDNGYVIDTDRSFFMCDKTEMHSANISGMTNDEKEMVFFIMGVKGFNYSGLNAYKTKKSFAYIPKTIALQIGAFLFAIYGDSYYDMSWEYVFTDKTFKDMRKKMPLPEGFESISGFLNEMSPMGKMYFAKYFKNWANRNYSKIAHFYVERKRNNKQNKQHDYKTRSIDCHLRFFIDDEADYYKTILNQGSVYVKELTSDLLAPVIIVRGNVNSFRFFGRMDGRLVNKPLTRSSFLISRDMAKTYLEAFLKKLRELYNIGEDTGNLTTQAKTADKVTDDMKMELYRYLKQIYDKWIPTVDFDDWKFETFFGKECKDPDLGHQFHFIDSYYNKTNNKLLINPKELSVRIGASLASTDINVMMHTFLADVYAQHRCMLRCVQNFADLANYNDMKDMFKPIPYYEMGKPKIHPDFVVIYTYEPSRNLNIDNGEFKDDGFMLNEEMETPMAIRTRVGKDSSTFYQIPAFGVAYGKQYQNYFKNVSVNMSSPIQTQQSLIAKHSILQGAYDTTTKTVTAQDLYDIYSTYSYTCNVEMMGCAWVQPMMYFVLLNIPMFRGSYMIMKVNHKITPGNMTTTFTGCRMSNTGNRFIEDIFSDEDSNEALGSESGVYQEQYADIDNDCKYRVYPLINGSGEDYSAELSKKITADMCGNNASIITSKNDTLRTFLAKIVDQEAGSGSTELQKMLVATTIYNRRASSGNYKNEILKQPQYDVKKAINQTPTDVSLKIIDDIFTNSPSYILGKYTKTTVSRNDLIVKSKKAGKWYKKGDKVKSSEITTDKLSTIKYFCNYCELSTCKPNTWVENQYAIIAQDAASNGSTGHLFYSDDESKSYWKADNKKTDATLTNENIYKLLFDAVQKSLYSSDKASVNIKYAYVGNDKKSIIKPMIITQEDGKTDKLPYVFDIILNSEEYYKHVQTLYWIVENGADAHYPVAIVVEAALQPDKTKKRILVGKLDENKPKAVPNFTYIKDKSKPVTDKMLLSLVKHYGDVKVSPYFKKDCYQFENALDMFDDLIVNNCDSVMGNSGNINYTGGNVAPGAKIKIGNWDVEKSIAWINQYAREAYNTACKSGSPRKDDGSCEGLCASYVLEAICCKGNGVFPESNFPNGKGKRITCGSTPRDGAATNLRYAGILGKYDFDIIKSGDCTKDDRVARGVQLQAGDIAVIGRSNTGKFHTCIWNGQQWVSDFKQGEKMSPYRDAINYPGETLPYAIYRYLYKKGVQATKK